MDTSILSTRCLLCKDKKPLDTRPQIQSLRIPMIGQRFGRFLVRHFVGVRGSGTYWCCLCDCGTVRTLTDWARLAGLPTNTLKQRLAHGWEMECALTTPPLLQRKLPPLIYNGEHKTLSEWAAQYGIPRDTLRSRVARGWDLPRAFMTPVAYKKE